MEVNEATVPRYIRLKRDYEQLVAQLPWNVTSLEETRPLDVAREAEWRYITAWAKEEVMTTLGFSDLVEIEPDHELLARQNARELLAELGKRMQALEEFIAQEVAGPLEKLALGLAWLDKQPLTSEADARCEAFITGKWLPLRRLVKQALPLAWNHACIVRELYAKLHPDVQKQAEAIWGPIKLGTSRAHGWQLFREYWPSVALAELDERAKRHGIWPAEEDRPHSRLAIRQERRKQSAPKE